MNILYYLLLFRKVHCREIMKIMRNCRRQGNRIACVSWTIPFVILAMFSPLRLRCLAHLIQIDHHEFRASGFPRPHLPPPVDQLTQQLYPTKELTPVELMVDLTNDLTYRILHYHSILNRNNFAFSPCSLMSVLVALYEGSAGRSATELRNVLQFPNNRDVIRIGYRDIHRRLRTYFFGSENPLKGLSLNKENVTITRDYETIVKFYGYDLGMDMVSSTASPTTTTTIPTTTTMPTMTDSTTTVVQPVNTATLSQSQPEETSTERQMVPEPTNPITTTTATSIMTSTTTPVTATITTTSTENPTETTIPTLTTTEETTDTAPETTTLAATTDAAVTEISTTPAVTDAATEAESPTTPATTEREADGEKEEEAAELVSSFIAEEAAEPFLRIQKARVSRLPSAKLQAPPIPTTPREKYLPSMRSGAIFSRQSRHKRHILNVKEMDSNLFVTLFNAQPVHHSIFPITGPSAGTAVVHSPYEVDVDPHFLRTSVGTKQNYNTDVISHVFYLGHQQLIHTTFKVYNAVLYFKYFDNLKMSVLELELDTPEYNLIILLPDYHTDLVTAAASLKSGPTLRLMRKQLKPRWVQAIIPDFELHGTMFLTNDLQNMGICDIFEPNRADLHPMTNENRVYVKHIEQSINVNIRTRPINQLKRNYGTQTQPIQISVSHPFIFFIIDRDLDVAVMAGRILNPQNVRIQ